MQLKCPDAKCPWAKCPGAKCPNVKCPDAKCPGAKSSPVQAKKSVLVSIVTKFSIDTKNHI